MTSFLHLFIHTPSLPFPYPESSRNCAVANLFQEANKKTFALYSFIDIYLPTCKLVKVVATSTFVLPTFFPCEVLPKKLQSKSQVLHFASNQILSPYFFVPAPYSTIDNCLLIIYMCPCKKAFT